MLQQKYETERDGNSASAVLDFRLKYPSCSTVPFNCASQPITMLRPRSWFLLIALLSAPAAAHAAGPVEVVIRGIEGDLLANAQKALVLPYGLVQDNNVNSFWLDRFVAQAPDRVRVSLEPYGYYNPEIRASLERPGGNLYRVVVDVSPGRPVRITSVRATVQGPGRSEEQLLKRAAEFPLRSGDVLVQPRYEVAKADLRQRAIDLGYLDAVYTSHTITVDPGKSAAAIDIVLDTGPRYFFGPVRFEGAAAYPDRYLHRFVAFKQGDVFSYAKLGETQANLINTERFKHVVPVPEKDRAQGLRVPIVIRIEEAPSKKLRPGVGYATDIGARFSLDYRDLNVFGRGHEFRSELNLATRLQSFGASYVVPGEDIRTTTGLLANVRREDTTTYTIRNITTELNRTQSFGKGRLGTVYLRFEREHSTIGVEPVDSRLVLPGVRFSEQRLDSLIRPTKGHQYSIDIRGTDESIGSNNSFLQGVFDGNVLVPLPWRLSLISRLKVGATMLNTPVTSLPVSYRFFAGGDRSVRGYSYQSLGPTNQFGQVIGGRDTLVASIELDRALFANWGVAAFYDAGNAFDSFRTMHLAQGAGVGVRYYTVVGALRLDVARQIGVVNPSYRIHFTVGLAF